METTAARDLSFEERVGAQEAIARVYYSHQLEANRPFEEAVPQSLLRDRVRTILQETVALETLWKTPVTAAMLERETRRMARQTRMPDRLRELYSALGNDDFLFEETVARAAVVERLARSFFSSDQTIQRDARERAETLRRSLSDGRIDPRSPRSERTTLDLAPDELDRWAPRLPDRVGAVSGVREEPDAFDLDVVLERHAHVVRVANFRVAKVAWSDWWPRIRDRFDARTVRAVASSGGRLPDPVERPDGERGPGTGATYCTDDTWNPTALGDLPDPRSGHTAVWTGSLMIVWGGGGDSNTGGRYDPATDTWIGTSTAGAPTARHNHTAVWTGSRMIVWGGLEGSTMVQTGGLYDPVADVWAKTSTIAAPSARNGHTAVWTGDRMIVWGGRDGGGETDTGAGYSPLTDSWSPTSALGAPSPREGHSAVWTGTRMIVWGGYHDVPNQPEPVNLDTGALYDPSADGWRKVSDNGAPSPRMNHTATWTGNQMVIWGGRQIGNLTSVWLDTGARYDPAGDTWTPTTAVDAPSARGLHTAVWDGSEVLVWGGFSGTPDATYLQTGGRYDPVTDVWTATTTANAPSGRAGHTAVWTGSLQVVWGGADSLGGRNTGGRYNPATDSWTPTSGSDVPVARSHHKAVWTGSLMVVWGGWLGGGNVTGTGGRYDPALDLWSPTSTAGAPTGRYGHVMVWTGATAIVWGGLEGSSSTHVSTGGRYDPIADTWSPTSLVNAPPGSTGFSGIWTGRLLVVWGGLAGDGTTFLDTGGRYDPASDIWTPTSTAGAPAPRFSHTAVWTGGVMVIWGGCCGSDFTDLATGGSYDPVLDQWSGMATAGAPAAREAHSSIWTGTQMVVWGGQARGVTTYGDGGRYDPVADAWSPMSNTNAPAARGGHLAAWTGEAMIVWGGGNSGLLVDGGGRYEPALDQWSPTSQINAPDDRVVSTAVWTGDQMIVWGGLEGQTRVLSSGGLYCACSGSVATYYQDRDGDGRGDPGVWIQSCLLPYRFVATAGDCNDSDSLSWQSPSEAQDLVFLDDSTMSWSPPVQMGATTVLYDVIRSDDPADFVTAAICSGSDLPETQSQDASAPAIGRAYFYLIRAKNPCPDGQGDLGAGSDGIPRQGRSCP